MWNKMSSYLSERALCPSWYDYLWMIPAGIIQIFIGLTISLYKKIVK